MKKIALLNILLIIVSFSAFAQPSSKILSKVENATVFIHLDFVITSSAGVQVGKSMGSGFIVSSEGLVITNAHVISHNNIINKINIIFRNNINYTADIIRLDYDYDIAILKINTTDIFADYLSIANDFDIKDGTEVNFIGYPLQPNFQQQSISLRASVSSGLINRKNQKTSLSKSDMEIFEISSDANPGNSGGPCFNLKTGEVIGVITKRLATQSTGISFAVPAKYIIPLVQFDFNLFSKTTILDSDLIELIESFSYELEENKIVLERNTSILKMNISLKDSGKTVVINPTKLKSLVWDNAKINKIKLINKLEKTVKSFISDTYYNISAYNDLIDNRNKYLIENQAMTNYNKVRIQNDKSTVAIGEDLMDNLIEILPYLSKLIE